VLRDLVHLFALSVMERDLAGFRAADYLSSAQAGMVSRQVLRLCRYGHIRSHLDVTAWLRWYASLRSLRLEAVALVDSWMMSDRLLNSALGRYDGRAYSALLNLARRSPLNESEVASAYHKSLVHLINPESGTARLWGGEIDRWQCLCGRFS
jgi:hypothetical protein